MDHPKVKIVNSCHRYSTSPIYGSAIVNPKAFTLIEILVVIAIIALLMTILVPVLRSARNQARAVVCQANLKQWGAVLALYTDDNDGILPPGSGSEILWLIRGTTLLDGDPNKPPVYHHIRTKDIACCPMAIRAADDDDALRFESSSSLGGSKQYWIEGKPGSTFEAWEIITPPPRFRGSYGYNYYLFNKMEYDTSVSMDYSIHWDGMDIFKFRNVAKIPVFLDSTMPDILVFSYFHPWSSSACINRHNGYVNGLFLDWSARRVGLKELWTLKWNKQFDTSNKWTKAGGMQPEDWPKWMRNFKDY